MAIYLKKANEPISIKENDVRHLVKEMLDNIRDRREAAAVELAAKFDGWNRDFILSREEIDALIATVPQRAKDDIRFAHEQVYGFAVKQRESMQAFETELTPGVTLGQRLIPCQCAGCYVPGGRFAHAASAVMSVATAKAAGVPFIVACTPPRGDSINATVAYALSLSGADVVMAMGGVQAIGTMAFGLFTGRPADILVGPGNAFVAEAKRMLYGESGIDVFAGPTESLVIANKTADPLIVAVDLVSQCEHGYDSPVWLLTDSKSLGETVIDIMPKVIADLPDPSVADSSWENLGEVVLCADREEMARVSDDYAAEHVQVIAEDLDWYLTNLKNYGSLFLGEGCTVAYGDKTSGTNHILPTKKAARYSGGLNVGKFIKTLTYQRLTKEANRTIGAVASRVSRYEGMEGHARAADIRLRKYFPGETFDFEVYDQKSYV
ncbi:MAG: histidinol dehydrogenase [Desulfosarcina sp.]|nr:histidinol dehydrogenase [Desulfosarcina sp.]MBC2764747.1 histidinol dehydrogenase [Desulfosarcina sp.]